MLKVFWTVVVVAVAIIGGGLIYIYSGAYDPSAQVPHSQVIQWVLENAKDQAVKEQSDDVRAPQFIAGWVEEGAQIYAETCQTCHGGPGRTGQAFTQYMSPQPPEMALIAREHSSEYIHWVARSGLKMSGMPAFGPLYSDEALWQVVAFIKELPNMSVREFEAMTGPPPTRQELETLRGLPPVHGPAAEVPAEQTPTPEGETQ